jgi:hypothetical protein
VPRHVLEVLRKADAPLTPREITDWMIADHGITRTIICDWQSTARRRQHKSAASYLYQPLGSQTRPRTVSRGGTTSPLSRSMR